jgi:predicted nuclease of predicted toxin-antitoxin system
MKVLIDENLPRKLADHLKGHECRTVAECGWAGKQNGELLSLAGTEFEVLLTLDKNIPYQQDLKLGRIARLIVRAPSNRIQDLLLVIPDCLAALQSIGPGQVARVGHLPTR